MKSHGEIQDTLYDFVMNDLSPEDRDAVMLHLETCGACRAVVEELEALASAIPRPQERPSDSRDDAHWARLAAHIEKSLPPARILARRNPVPPLDRIRMLISAHRPAIALALAALVLGVSAILILRPWEHEVPADGTAQNAGDGSVEGIADRGGEIDEGWETYEADMAAHLRRSKNLLVGLTNKPVDLDLPADLSIEREVSRSLLADNRRYLSEVLDPQSSAVFADLEKIMIEVANSREDAPAADLDLIRQGIRQQNLLFKVRMAEQLSSRGMIVRASGRMTQEE